MSRKPRNHHEKEASRLNNQRGGGKTRGKPPRDPSAGEHTAASISTLNAWQLGELDLEMIKAVWDLCLEESPHVLSGVKTPCLEWVGATGEGPWEKSESKTGTLNYGLYWFGGELNQHIRTHALTWRLAGNQNPSLDIRTKTLTKNGKPTTMDISHQCNKRRCCNPDHLRLETHSENMKYKGVSKKRAAMELAADEAHLRTLYSGLEDNPEPIMPVSLTIKENTEDFLAKWAGVRGKGGGGK